MPRDRCRKVRRLIDEDPHDVIIRGAHFNHFLGFAPFSNRWVESNGPNRREFRTRGEIRFTANDQDVESMSPGARFLVEVADGWRVRSVEFEADDQGNIERRYSTPWTAPVTRNQPNPPRALTAHHHPQPQTATHSTTSAAIAGRSRKFPRVSSSDAVTANSTYSGRQKTRPKRIPTRSSGNGDAAGATGAA